MKIVHIAVAAALALAFAGQPALSPAIAQNAPRADAIEGADFIAGKWQFSGSFSDQPDGVGFTATFARNGTFVDQDNYPGRWIVSGQTFAMFYPDESELGYVGVIRGDEIVGRFRGRTVSGDFRMRRGQ